MVVEKGQNFQALVLSCNKDGMDALRKGQHKAAFEQFKYAEAVLIANQAEGDVTSLSAVTCNNLGCYYKKVGKMHGALSYLRRALQMEIDLRTDEVTLAGTHLNICAILSKLEKHDKAVQHAVSALDLISGKVQSSDDSTLSQDEYSVLAIAYHNVAVERDFLHHYDKAASAFQQGYQVARRYLGDEHPLTLALQKNCAAVLDKSTKVGKASASIAGGKSWVPTVDAPKDDKEEAADGLRERLPVIAGAQPADSVQDATMTPAAQSSRQEAGAWASDPMGKPLSAPLKKALPAATELYDQGQQANLALRESHLKDLIYPSFKDAAVSRDLAIPAPSPSVLSPPKRKTLPLRESLEDPPEAIMDIIDADSTGQKLGPSRFAANDFRPNRVVRGSTRTARVVRRTGLYQSTKHRDQIISQRHTGHQPKSVYIEKAAAEKIQRFWRAWKKYCVENADWIDSSTGSATKIQACWRAYKVRKDRLDRSATTIQRHVRGRLVRKALRRVRAAVTIQRHVIGMLTRTHMAKLQRAAVRMQALIRGFLGKRRAARKRRSLTKTAVTIQSGVRMMIGKRKVRERRAAWKESQSKVKLALNCQRFYRGWKGRERFALAKAKYEEDVAQYHAATKLQALARRDQAQKRVDDIRAQRLDKMAKAATLIGKIWRGYSARKKYKITLQDFARHEQYVVTLQRFARGFLVRVRMWREAVRTEEQLWGALEIQRVWRGYVGRVRWENALEKVWKAETSAALIQRTMRGWLARCRVGRLLRKIARGEFERARLRFRSAQKLQALVRGVLVRTKFQRRLKRSRDAALVIQRIHRGHIVRKRLWAEVLEMRALVIQARARGFLVRNRRFHLVAKVIHIQRAYRKWLKKPQDVRAARFEHMQVRKRSAAKIQQKYREGNEKKAVAAAQDSTSDGAKRSEEPAAAEVEAPPVVLEETDAAVVPPAHAEEVSPGEAEEPAEVAATAALVESSALEEGSSPDGAKPTEEAAGGEAAPSEAAVLPETAALAESLAPAEEGSSTDVAKPTEEASGETEAPKEVAALLETDARALESSPPAEEPSPDAAKPTEQPADSPEGTEAPKEPAVLPEIDAEVPAPDVAE